MELKELRLKIDEIDTKLVQLFIDRLDIAVKVAEYKKENELPVYDPIREQEVLDKISSKVSEKRKEAITEIYKLIFKLSKEVQENL